MPRPRRILLADNRDSHRETYAEFLQLRGFQVAGVRSPEACLHAVETNPPHLAILDLRMRSEDDENDRSGLTLAKQLPAQLPKIVLTAFPTWETAREVLTPVAGGWPPATFFASKLEGLDVLEDYVNRTFTEQVRLNWDLQVNWPASARQELAALLLPKLTGTVARPEADTAWLEGRALELEDLCCRLFLNAAHAQVDRLLWQQAGLAALQVLVGGSGQQFEPLLVVCGQPDLVRQAANGYRELAAQTRQLHLPAQQTELAETVHYAANAYALGGLRQQPASSLAELYERGLGQAAAGLRVDTANQLAWVDGRLLKLTVREFQLLRFLYERQTQLCTRQQIIEEFFNYAYDPQDDSQAAWVNTNIKRLRAELETDPQQPRYLQTVRGRGYRLEPEAPQL